MTNTCRTCGDDVHPQRWLLGYRVCLLCGEEHAREERAGWTIAPMAQIELRPSNGPNSSERTKQICERVINHILWNL
jgi:hypothetical protein